MDSIKILKINNNKYKTIGMEKLHKIKNSKCTISF